MTGTERALSAGTHLLGLFTWAVGPLVVLWLTRSAFVEKHASDALNWQLTVGIVTHLAAVLALTTVLTGHSIPILWSSVILVVLLGGTSSSVASPRAGRPAETTGYTPFRTPMFGGEWHPILDPSFLEWLVEATPEWIGVLLVPITYIGSVFVIAPAVVIAYWWDPERLGTWLGAFFGYYGLMGGIKSLNDATRPTVGPAVGPEAFPSAYSSWYDHATAIGSTSFPSGNAMVAALIIGLMVVDLRVSTLRRRALVGSFAIVVIGYTRLGLGVHYPVDVVAGIVLGLALAATVVVLRRRVTDVVGAVFVLGALLAFVGLWLRSGGMGVPSWDGLQGSNRLLAFGGAVGGLLVWRLGHATDWRFGTTRSSRSLFVVLLAIVAGAYAIHLSISHPLITILWAAVVFGAVVALPYVRPRRTERREFAALSSDETA